MSGQQYPNHLDFEYNIRIEVKNEKSYRLHHYNSLWENLDRALEDIRIVLEGKDLNNNDFPVYKVVDWESWDPGIYDLVVKTILYRHDDTKPYEQTYRLLKKEKVEN